MTLEREFPDFDDDATFEQILDTVKDYGFEDISWHNDTMPCIGKKFENDFSLVIWVDYKDPNKSQFVDQRKNESMRRFMFGETDQDGEYIEEWQYDNVEALLSHVSSVMIPSTK